MSWDTALWSDADDPEEGGRGIIPFLSQNVAKNLNPSSIPVFHVSKSHSRRAISWWNIGQMLAPILPLQGFLERKSSRSI